MKVKNKVLVLVIVIISLLCTNVVFSNSILIEKVKEAATPITFNEGNISKKITNIDQEKNEVTIQSDFKLNEFNTENNQTEIVILNDDSGSMNTEVNGSNTRKEEILNFEKQLINNVMQNNNNTKIGIVKFSSGAYAIQDLTNDTNKLINVCDNAVNKRATGETQMFSGIKLAKSKFSSDAKNKILLVFTDGLPTDNHKVVKESLQDDNIYIVTTLVGLENATENQQKTISNIFGTESNPVANKFYNISDAQIEQTINQNIYQNIIEKTQYKLTDVSVKDIISDEILNNFEVQLKMPTIGSARKDNNQISWYIPEINSSETATLEYVLKLNENYDRSIINKVLDTSKQANYTYNDFNNNLQTNIMSDSPQIILRDNNEIETNNDEVENEDDTKNEVEIQVYEEENKNETEEDNSNQEEQKNSESQVDNTEVNKRTTNNQEIEVAKTNDQSDQETQNEESSSELQTTSEVEQQENNSKKIESNAEAPKNTEQEQQVIDNTEEQKEEVVTKKEASNTVKDQTNIKNANNLISSDSTTATKALSYAGSEHIILIVVGALLVNIFVMGIKIKK